MPELSAVLDTLSTEQATRPAAAACAARQLSWCVDALQEQRRQELPKTLDVKDLFLAGGEQA